MIRVLKLEKDYDEFTALFVVCYKMKWDFAGYTYDPRTGKARVW